MIASVSNPAPKPIGGSGRFADQPGVVNTPYPTNVYHLVGILRMARSGDRSDLLAAGVEPGPVREQFASEISDDAMWVAAARDGDRAAFGQLYERYARMVHGVLLSKVAVGELMASVRMFFFGHLAGLQRFATPEALGPGLAR